MIRFLYHNLFGRIILKIITAPWVSRFAGRFLDTRRSTFLIPLFIKAFDIDLAEVKPAEWMSFNEFFTRRLVDGARPVDSDPDALISPCDGYLSACDIRRDTILTVKNVPYTVEQLLGDRRLAAAYRDGLCLIFRLTPADYHRYCYPDSGRQLPVRRIRGVLHTVQPVATETVPVYARNCREYTVLDTDHFGPVIYMEVGAMLVGRITNLHMGRYEYERGEEKGQFEYGGSTVILLLKKDAVSLREDIKKASSEIPVKQGERIGIRL